MLSSASTLASENVVLPTMMHRVLALLLYCISQTTVQGDTGLPRDLWFVPIHLGNSSPLSTPLIWSHGVSVANASVETFDSSGKEKWSVPLKRYQPRGLLATPLGLVVAEEPVWLARSSDGAASWSFNGPGNFSFAIPVLDGNIVIVGNDLAQVIALDYRTGAEQWSIALPQDGDRTIVTGMSVYDNYLYVTSVSLREHDTVVGSFAKFDLSNRALVWRIKNPINSRQAGFTTSPLLADCGLLVGDGIGNALFCFALDTGSVKWRMNGIHDAAGPSEAPFIDGKKLYMTSGDRHLYALETKTGKLIWTATFPGSVTSVARCGRRILVLAGLLYELSGEGELIKDEERSISLSGFTLSHFGISGSRLTFYDSAKLRQVSCNVNPY